MKPFDGYAKHIIVSLRETATKWTSLTYAPHITTGDSALVECAKLIFVNLTDHKSHLIVDPNILLSCTKCFGRLSL